MSEQESHLSAKQIDVLVEASPGSLENKEDVALLEDALRHLKICKACQRLVSMHRECDRILAHLRYETDGETRDDCPPEKSLYELAARIVDDRTADRILEHLVHCAHCSIVLRRASEDVGPETTAQEEALLSSLKTSSEGWQKKFANQLAAIKTRALSETKTASQPIVARTTRAFGWRYVYATAAVILLVVGVWTYKKFSEPRVDRLLAQAYSEQRTMELRIAGAEHAPLRQERGAGVSSLTKPSSLLKAEYEIESQLAVRSEDADALGAKGRAELLEWQYAAAIASLRHALDLTPDSPELLGDLATAYVQRGDTENRPLDYGEAIEYLGRALNKKPNDPVFLFNRALVDERLALFEEASKDWENYLRVDPRGPWADEARERLESLRLKLRHSLEIPPAEHDPERAVSLLEARVKGSVDATVWMESLDEDYFDVAVKEWIPSLGNRLSRSATMSAEAPEERALNLLSVILASQHRDPWLSDLLSGRLSSGVFEGLTELGRAAQLNSQGDFDAAVVASHRAMLMLAKKNCVSGVLRALWEQTYALQRSQQGRLCLGKAREAMAMRGLSRYPWLSAQLELEQSVCLAMVGQLTLAQEGMRKGLEVAQSAGYGTLVLRGMHMAGVEIAANDPERSWLWFEQGLHKHWAGAYRPFRAYQFYAEMSFTPESRGEWFLARQLMDEASIHMGRTPNHLTEAMALHSLAVDTQLSGDLSTAADEFRKAAELFSSLPSSTTTRGLLFSAKVYEATLEAEQGRSELALASLAAARRNYTEQSQYRIWQHYYEALGSTLLEVGQNDNEAERALRAAVYISEGALATLHSDEDRLFWERNSAVSYRALVELEADRRKNAEAALELWEWYIAAGIRGSSKPAPDIRFDELDQGPALPKLSLVADSLSSLQNVSVISYARFESGYIVWFFDNRGIHEAAITAPRLEIDNTIRRFLRLCSDPHSDRMEVVRIGRRLYDWLVGPIQQHLTPVRLLAVETDGEIGGIPFNVLVTSSGEFLGQRFQIVTSPGLQFWSRLRESRPFSPSDRALIVGVSGGQEIASRVLPPLPDAEREAREVAFSFPKSTVLLGEEAKIDKVKRELPRVRVFHFAGHAIATAERNGLLFGISGSQRRKEESQWFSATDIEKLRTPELDLVVLSACATGADEYGLADPGSLVRTFLRTGAPQVIAARWSVDSAATAKLMGYFYGGLVKGLPASVALQNAQEAIRKQPLMSHPYYWASFGVFGRD